MSLRLSPSSSLCTRLHSPMRSFRRTPLFSRGEALSADDKYPLLVDDYVFLNDEPFSEEFKRVTSNIASGVCKYGLVPKEHWEEPPWIDEEKAAKARKEMEEKKVIYGGSKAYRRMCESRTSLLEAILLVLTRSRWILQVGMRVVSPSRQLSYLKRLKKLTFLALFEIGFFFRHSLLDQYDYYWVSDRR